MTPIDCVSHWPSGSAILTACGVNQDGTLADASSTRPKPVILILPLRSYQKRIATIRVAASQLGNKTGGRFFNLQFSKPIEAFAKMNGKRVPVVYTVLSFGQGNTSMRVVAAMRDIGLWRKP